MFSFLPRLVDLKELPVTITSLLMRSVSNQSSESKASEDKTSPVEQQDSDVIHTFVDFYEKLLNIKLAKPSLNFSFLDERNIEGLKIRANHYSGINDCWSVEDAEVVKRYLALKSKHQEYKNFDQTAFNANNATNEMESAIKLTARAEAMLEYYRYICELVATDEKKNKFAQLKRVPTNMMLGVPEKIDAINATWEKRKHLAFLSSPSLFEVKKLLDQIAGYIEMIESQFQYAGTISKVAYEYYYWISEDDKSLFIKLVEKVKIILAQEREKLAQAFICRLELVPKQTLIDAHASVAENNSIYDDVVLETMRALQPFEAKNIDRFEKIRRCTLTSSLIRDFIEFIVTYGNEEHKRKYSELINGSVPENQNPVQSEAVGEAMPLSVAPIASSENSKQEEDQRQSQPVDSMDKFFPIIREIGSEYFASAKFGDEHAFLYASFQKGVIEYIQKHNLDSAAEVVKACQLFCVSTIKDFIKNLAERLFPNPEQEILKQAFEGTALYFFSHFRDEKFDECVVNRAKESINLIKSASTFIDEVVKIPSDSKHEINPKQLEKKFILSASKAILLQHGNVEAAINAAKFDILKYVLKKPLKQKGVSDELLQEFDEYFTKYKKQIDAVPLQESLDQLLKQIDEEKSFIIAKHKLMRFFITENRRFKSDLNNHLLFISRKKTEEKAAAYDSAVAKVKRVTSADELRKTTKEFLTDKSIAKKRSVFSFLEGRSESKKKLITTVALIERSLWPK